MPDLVKIIVMGGCKKVVAISVPVFHCLDIITFGFPVVFALHYWYTQLVCNSNSVPGQLNILQIIGNVHDLLQTLLSKLYYNPT